MKLSELIDNLADQTGLPKTAISDVLRTLGAAAQAELSTEGGEIPLPGVGKLKETSKPAREGRNPATGAALHIPAKNSAKLVLSAAMKEALG